MSGYQQAELKLLFDRDGETYLVYTVKLGPKGDLYVINHHPILAGKQSIHAGGHTTTGETDLIGKRESRRHSKPEPLAALQGVKKLSGFGGGGTHNRPPGLTVDRAKTDTKIRKSLVLQWPSQPPMIWGAELWGYGSAADEKLVHGALETPPYPGGQVAGVLIADWSTPRLFVKVWKAPPEAMPNTIGVTNYVTGERFVRAPAMYVGTPFDAHIKEQNLWLPRPLPRSAYQGRYLHPFYDPQFGGGIDFEDNGAE